MKNTVKPWSKVHPDYRHVIDGRRYVLVLDDETGATVLAPWEGPTD